MFSNINQALDYIYSFIDLEKSEKKYKSKEYSLENITKLIKLFNIDLNDFKFIHVAGTKGKGSTCYFITYLLQKSGYKTAVFLSPHLLKPNERILYDFNCITDTDIIDITNIIKNKISKNEIQPTTFEMFFLIFLIYISDKKIDYCIVEAGLGGRLDTTNIITPILSVITTIGYDHINVLGNTLIKIANEKAGIIKKNIPVIVSKQKMSIANFFKKRAKSLNSKIFQTNKYIKIISHKLKSDSITFNFKFFNTVIKNININLLGIHQVNNFLTALLTVYQIDNNIIKFLNDNPVIKINIAARIQIINNKPLIIADVSHNKESVINLKKTLSKHFKGIKWIILSGMVKNKDYDTFYKILSKITDKLIITQPSFYKESESIEVYKSAKKYIKNAVYFENFDDAYNEFIKYDLPKLITGSFYITGPFLEKWYNDR